MAFDGSTCSRGWQWRIIKTVCKIRTRLSFMAMAISSTTVTRVTWATHHYDKPSNSQLWVWMALLKNTSQSISWKNVHFCIRSYSSLHTVRCRCLSLCRRGGGGGARLSLLLNIVLQPLPACSENSSIFLLFFFFFRFGSVQVRVATVSALCQCNPATFESPTTGCLITQH